MKQVDIFELAYMLEFDIRQTKLKSTVSSIMIVDENYNQIPGFNSNKVILYNNKKKKELIENRIIEDIYNYIKNKNEANKIHLVEVNRKNKYKINVNELVDCCIKKGLITSEKNARKIYKKCI